MASYSLARCVRVYRPTQSQTAQCVTINITVYRTLYTIDSGVCGAVTPYRGCTVDAVGATTSLPRRLLSPTVRHSADTLSPPRPALSLIVLRIVAVFTSAFYVSLKRRVNAVYIAADSVFLSPRKRGIMLLPALVCLSVCLSVCYHDN